MIKKLRVAAYARVSTDKDDQANSLDNQRNYFTDYITRHEGWQLVNVFYDEGISGTQTKKRKGFMEMIAEAEAGEIDLIITKEVSRFARNTVDTLSYTRELKKIGVGVIFTLDNIDTRQSDGEFRLTIMASIAQEESRKTSERVKWGQRRQMEKGVVFGRDLLGYTVKDGNLYINEEEAEIVRAIFHKYTNEGKGTHIIARELQEEGMRPKRIALWSNVVILRVLRNEKYVGDLMQKKTITPDYLTHKKKYNRGEEGMVYIKEHHEPIISRDLWERTQEELQRRSPSEEQKSKYSNRYWCSGKLFCAECGRRYVSRLRKREDGSVSKTWRCIAAAHHGRKKQDADGKDIGCDNTSVNEESLKTCMNYCISLIQSEREGLKKEILEEIKYIRKKQNQKLDIQKLEKQIKFMKENNYAFSYTDYEEIDEKSQRNGKVITGPKRIGRCKMYAYCWQGCLTVMYDAEKIGLVQIANLKKNNDYAMWLQAIKYADCYLLDEKLGRYRKRSGSISNSSYKKLIKSHYTMYRTGENRSRAVSAVYTVHNIFWGIYKKLKYVHIEK